MPDQIATTTLHHLTLTVSDLQRSLEFYRNLLGFNPVRERPDRVIMHNGSMALVLRAPGDDLIAPDDRFNENRVGLDHLSFVVENHAALEDAIRIFDAHAIPYGEIKDLGAEAGVYVLAFRDPDNIQLELTAPYSH
ncbi:MAG: VOC family protein [Chloroflexi bacterium]|nr:MAG: VOC family protein [Chloroflexota bacterium]